MTTSYGMYGNEKYMLQEIILINSLICCLFQQCASFLNISVQQS